MLYQIESMGIFGSKENKLALTFFLFVEFEDPSNIDVIVDVFKNIYLHFAQRGKLSLSWPCYGGVF